MDWTRKELLQSRQIGGEQMVHKVWYLPVLKRGVLLIESSDNCISQSSFSTPPVTTLGSRYPNPNFKIGFKYKYYT